MLQHPFELNVWSRGLRYVPMSLSHDGEFEFRIGGRKHKCKMIIAEFLAPKVCALRKADPTVEHYTLKTRDPKNQFSTFLSLAVTVGLKIDAGNFEFLVSVARELDNEDLLYQLYEGYVSGTELTASTAVRRLQMKKLCKGADEEEITFIAKNFHDVEDLMNLEVDHLKRVLCHPSLRIQSEDALYNFICGVIEKRNDPVFSELFEFVIFRFLSAGAFEHFLKTSGTYIIDHLNLSIWKSFCDRLAGKPLIEYISAENQKLRYGRVIVEDELLAVNKHMAFEDDELHNTIRKLIAERDNEAKKCRAFEQEIVSLRIARETQQHAGSSREIELQEKIRSLMIERDNEAKKCRAFEQEVLSLRSSSNTQQGIDPAREIELQEKIRSLMIERDNEAKKCRAFEEEVSTLRSEKELLAAQQNTPSGEKEVYERIRNLMTERDAEIKKRKAFEQQVLSLRSDNEEQKKQAASIENALQEQIRHLTAERDSEIEKRKTIEKTRPAVQDGKQMKDSELYERIRVLTEERDSEGEKRKNFERELYALRREHQSQKEQFAARESELQERIRKLIFQDDGEAKPAETTEAAAEEAKPEAEEPENQAPTNPFDGIIAGLRRECGGENPDRSGLMKVNASSIGAKEPHQILDYDWKSFFYTKGQPNSWIELDMMDRKVALTYYTLKSNSGGANCFKAWVIECSNDQQTWDIVDERKTNELVGKSIVKTYPVQKPTGTFYRYIRIRQTAKTSNNQDYFILCNMEIFGEVTQA